MQKAGELFGNVVDVDFPLIDPAWDGPKVKETAREYFHRCQSLLHKVNQTEENAIHLMGEMTFVYHFLCFAVEHGTRCVASTSRRIVRQNGQGKEVYFRFEQFRDYFIAE